MSSEEREDTTIYMVVMNDEEQYSIWPAEREIPNGWHDVGKKGLKQEFRLTVEFRHHSWLTNDIYHILEDSCAALCVADMPKLQCSRRITSDFVYVRLHGKPQLYRSLYTEEILREWSDWLGPQLDAGRDVFVYFNNDFNAHAVQNARQLRRMLTERSQRT